MKPSRPATRWLVERHSHQCSRQAPRKPVRRSAAHGPRDRAIASQPSDMPRHPHRTRCDKPPGARINMVSKMPTALPATIAQSLPPSVPAIRETIAATPQAGKIASIRIGTCRRRRCAASCKTTIAICDDGSSSSSRSETSKARSGGTKPTTIALNVRSPSPTAHALVRLSPAASRSARQSNGPSAHRGDSS